MIASSSYSKLSIIIPVFNEEVTVADVIQRVKKADTLGLTQEIVVVDDASTDQTWKHLQKIPNIRRIRHESNRGKGAAIRTGFMKATGDIVLIQDADSEYSPADYGVLLAPFFTFHADVVYGSRFRGSDARRVIYFSHHFANQILTTYSNILTNFNLTDMECGYKVFTKRIVDILKEQLVSERFGIEPELTARIAKIKDLKLYEVGISYQGRTYQEGKKIGFMDGIKALYEITYFNLFA